MWTGTLLIDLGNRSRVANNWQLFSLGRIGVGLAATAIFVHNDTMVEKLDAAFDNADSPEDRARTKEPNTGTSQAASEPAGVVMVSCVVDRPRRHSNRAARDGTDDHDPARVLGELGMPGTNDFTDGHAVHVVRRRD